MINPKKASVPFIILFVFIYNNITAQISEGGVPPSFLAKEVAAKSTQMINTVPVDFDVQQLKAEDALSDSKNMPMRVSMIIPIQFDINTSGEWTKLSSGQTIWRLTLKAEGALASGLYYDEFYIPKGAQLFIYNKDRTHLLGAYTYKTNPSGEAFANEFVVGDEFTLEYVAPDEGRAEDKPRIILSGFSYGYNHIQTQRLTKLNNSGSCMVNINCSEGDSWQTQKKGVVKTVTPIGLSGYLCSGTMINNTAKDFMPYYLTAHHCFWVNGVEARYGQMVFYFGYEFPDCPNLSVDPSSKTMTGANILVDLDINGKSDGALLKLDTDIPDNYDVSWNGWDRSNTAATSGVCIHHPAGDVKKISTFTSPLVSSTWVDGSTRGATGAHWRVIFAATAHGHSVTAGGSSGSPLFNQSGLVVGTLSGGSSDCSAPNSPDYYGKFWYHWDQAGTAADQQMKTYLDPLNTGQTTLLPIDKSQIHQLTVIADNIVRTYGSPNPDVSGAYTVVGLIDGDDMSVFTTLPTASINNAIYSANKDAGQYAEAVRVSGAVIADPDKYTLVYRSGMLTIDKSPQTITFASISAKRIGDPDFSLSVSASSGLGVACVSSEPLVAKIEQGNMVSIKRTGNTTIIASQGGDNNYLPAQNVSRELQVLSAPLYITEAFSPNGDGVNDYFLIQDIEQYPNNELSVFDGNGKIHYQTTGYRNDWDGIANRGTLKGSKVPVGTYYYVLKIDGKVQGRSFVVIKY